MLEEFIEFLNHQKIRGKLYHFTDAENLASVRQHGLVSKQFATNNDIEISRYGGNDHSHTADRIKGLYDYVNLCFCRDHPMEYRARMEGRIEKTRFLAVKPEILRTPGVKVTLDVANKSGVPLLEIEDAIEHIDYEVIYTRTDWTDSEIKQRLQQARKCEILVPTRVPLEYIVEGL